MKKLNDIPKIELFFAPLLTVFYFLLVKVGFPFVIYSVISLIIAFYFFPIRNLLIEGLNNIVDVLMGLNFSIMVVMIMIKYLIPESEFVQIVLMINSTIILFGMIFFLIKGKNYLSWLCFSFMIFRATILN